MQAAGRGGAGVLGGTGVQQARRRAAESAVGPAGCALGALSLFLARFDSVFFRSQIF